MINRPSGRFQGGIKKENSANWKSMRNVCPLPLFKTIRIILAQLTEIFFYIAVFDLVNSDIGL
jgi:hypothetical protein